MPRKRLTLKDKQKKKQQTSFVGRTEQLTAFQENLNLSAELDAFINIFNIYGQGGVGKTTLLRKYEDSCGRKDVLTAYTDEGVKDVVDFMAAVASELDKKGHPLKKFNERYKVYRQKKQELEADTKAPEGLAAFMGSSIVKGSAFALKATPGISPFVDMVDTDGLAKHAGEWASFVAKKIGNKDEVQLVLEPIEVLTPIWLEGLADIAEDQRVCLLIDTYEKVSTFLDEWLYKVIDNRYADFDANILLTIAGRHPLDENRWSTYAEFCAAFPIDPFTEEEANTFLDQRKITAEPVRAAIKKLSGNVPVLMATLAKASPDKVEDLEDVSHLAVDRFLKWIENPNKRSAALYGAVPQELNIDVLKKVLSEDTAAEAFDWLQSMPFVQKRAKQWAYHPVVREQMLKYLRLRSMEEWEEIQGKLYEYYQSKQSALVIKKEDAYKNEKWRQYSLRLLYHGFCGQPEAYLPIALNAFVAALDKRRSFALEAAQTLRDAEIDTEVASEQVWGIAMEHALKEYDTEQYSQLERLMKRLLDTGYLMEAQQPLAYAWQANCLMLYGEYERSIELFSRSIELDPEYKWALANRGETYRQKGEYEEALSDFDQAIELDPEDKWALNKRGVVYSQMGKYEEALLDFDQAIELDPEDKMALANRGVIYLRMGKYEEALLDFDQAIELDPEYKIALANRGVIYLRMGKYEEALLDFDQAIELDPEYKIALVNRGEMYSRMGKYEEALLDFDQAIELDPEYKITLVNRGITYRKMGKYEEALLDFDQAIELDPEYELGLASRGITYRLMGKYNESLSDFDRLIEINPEDAWALAYRGEMYGRMGKYEGALSDFDQAIELDPEDKRALAFRGVTYRRMGKYEEALSDLDQAIDLDPERAWALANRGVTYLEMDEVKKAKLSFQEATRIDDKNDWSYCMLYLCSLKLDEGSEEHLNQAIALCEESLEKNENNHRVRFNLALYRLVQGNYDNSQRIIGEALEKGATDHYLNVFLEDLKFFLKLFPDTKPVQQMFAWVEERKLSYLGLLQSEKKTTRLL